MSLTDLSIKRPVFATVVSLMMIVLGIASLMSLPIRELPQIDPPVVQVTTTYTGASAAVVDTQITELIEGAVAGIEGIKTISSQSRDERSQVVIEFKLNRDVDAAANGRTYPNRYFIQGDAELVAQGLARRLKGRIAVEPGFAADVARTKALATEEYLATLGPYASFAGQLRAVMPRDALWVRDITISNSTWGNRVMQVYGPRDAVHPVGAAIGPGLPLGIGAAMGAGERKTVAMVGDGGFAMNLTELWTAVQERARLCTIVMNDRGYGVIRHIQDAVVEGRRFGDDLRGPDLEQLAALAGLPFFRVSAAEEFGATVARALAVDGPTLVEVDMVSIGEFPPYAPYNIMGKHAERAQR